MSLNLEQLSSVSRGSAAGCKHESMRTVRCCGLLLVLVSCGGGGAPASTDYSELDNQARSFPGIGNIETLADSTGYRLRWSGVDHQSATYGIFRALNGEAISFESDPIGSTTATYWDYVLPPDGEAPVCFAIRVLESQADTNTKQLCTPDSRFTFKGISSIERQADGTYVLAWTGFKSPLVYFIFSRRFPDAHDYSAPAAIVESDFWQSPLPDRGDTICYVAVSERDAEGAASRSAEVCTETEAPIEFSGVASVVDLGGGSVEVAWILSSSSDVRNYRIYQGSDFKEMLLETTSDQASARIDNLIVGRQYNFGIRAVDEYGREDENILVRPIILHD